VLLNPRLLRRATINRPHPFGKGRGGGGFVLASEGTAAVLIEPTSLSRGEGLVYGLLCEVGGDLWWGGRRWWWKDERE